VIPASKVAEKSDESGKRTVSIETFEGFSYKVTAMPAKGAEDKMVLTVAVTAELPKERKKEEGEKPEDAKTKDTAFADRLKSLNEKLAKEQKFGGRTYEVSKTAMDSVLKERDQLITKAAPAPTAGESSNGAVQQLPGGMIAPPPPARTATTRPIEAVTPPIAVPPLEEKEADDGAKKESGKE